jgi:hypothetical protein
VINLRPPLEYEHSNLFESLLEASPYQQLTESFFGVFRDSILALLPAAKLAKHFSATMGRPTMELYAMIGLIVIKEFMNWTIDEAVAAYLYDLRVRFALNLGDGKLHFSAATLARYQALLRDDELAGMIFDDITQQLIRDLDIKIKRQRLDSTHFYSDMATFARTKLMGVTIKRFLIQLKRHHDQLYQALPNALHLRYEKPQNQLFADASKDAERRTRLRSEVAREMHQLIQLYSGNTAIEAMTSFKNLTTVFSQQCEVKDCIKVEPKAKAKGRKKVVNPTPAPADAQTPDPTPAPADAQTPDPTPAPADAQTPDPTPAPADVPAPVPELLVQMRKKTGGAVIQNPSDIDASYDGKKGPGYQVQIAETCAKDNPVQLITCAIIQTASVADARSLLPVIDKLYDQSLMPEKLFADTAYGGDDNVNEAAALGVMLHAPVPGSPPAEPQENPDDKALRLAARRKDQEAVEWHNEYKNRAPLEGTNSGLKRRVGLGRLRVRGRRSVELAVFCKLAGWNISRAAVCPAMRQKLRAKFARARQRTSNALAGLLQALHFTLRLPHARIFQSTAKPGNPAAA